LVAVLVAVGFYGIPGMAVYLRFGLQWNAKSDIPRLLSISQRGLDYLIANRRLPTSRIGGRVLIPVADLRKYARGDHPERIVV
jgi:hypothetical protein